VSRLRFDPRRPLFVAQPLQAFGKVWEVGLHFPWEEQGMDYQEGTIHQLYSTGMLQHRPDLESSMIDIIEQTIGDGLESLTLEALHNLRDSINKRVKARVTTQRDYDKKHVAFSRIKDKQIAKIRSWRAAYGHMEN